MTRKKSSELRIRLNEALELAGMKPSELATKTGIPKSMISYYLAGKSVPRADRIYELSKALGVSETWLMGFDVEITDKKESSPDELQLTEGEKALIKLFRKVPAMDQPIVIEKILSALSDLE